MLTRNVMRKIQQLKEICRQLETDIQETISEIVELLISRDKLIEELKEARKQLYEEYENAERTNTQNTL